MNVVDNNIEWLPLTEYSSEYGISISTLRRKIKGKKIKYKLLHGKYYLPKQPLPTQSEAFAPVPKPKVNSEVASGQQEATKILVDELKKAYMSSLQSKEEQIIQLKQQITDLKTLVMYLEKMVPGSREEDFSYDSRDTTEDF